MISLPKYYKSPNEKYTKVLTVADSSKQGETTIAEYCRMIEKLPDVETENCVGDPNVGGIPVTPLGYLITRCTLRSAMAEQLNKGF